MLNIDIKGNSPFMTILKDIIHNIYLVSPFPKILIIINGCCTKIVGFCQLQRKIIFTEYFFSTFSALFGRKVIVLILDGDSEIGTHVFFYLFRIFDEIDSSHNRIFSPGTYFSSCVRNIFELQSNISTMVTVFLLVAEKRGPL